MHLISPQPLVFSDLYRRRIQDSFLVSDHRALAPLLPLADLGRERSEKAMELAASMVSQIRNQRSPSMGMEALLHEFSLSSEEGVVLMSLAEALMRIPDEATVDTLISDRLGSGHWERHLGRSPSRFVNASAWGLLFTGRLINFHSGDQERLGRTLRQLVLRLGLPVVRRAVRFAVKLMADQFVFAQNIADALEKSGSSQFAGLGFSFDMLGEGARCMADADRYYERYMQAIDAITDAAGGDGVVGDMGISIKLSALYPRYEFPRRSAVMNHLAPRVMALATRARESNIGLTIDAEEAHRLDLSLDVFSAVFSSDRFAGWHGFGFAVQAYQKRAMAVIDYLNHLAASRSRQIMVRLVKGAYWDTEIKLAQVKGLADYPVFTSKDATDVSYLACARALLNSRSRLYPQFATHNAHSIAAVLTMAGDSEGYEFQRLHGMGEGLHELARQQFGTLCRVYAPVGEHSDLLAYLARRLLENGANTSFVSNLADEQVPIEAICRDPASKLIAGADGDSASIPLPLALYGPERNNSKGIELSDGLELEKLRQGMMAAMTTPAAVDGGGIPVWNPADTDDLVGSHYRYTSKEEMLDTLATAHEAHGRWRAVPVGVRARLLRTFAEHLEAQRDELVMLCVREAGKTVADSLAEVREAVDFCRYYASLGEQTLQHMPYKPLGVLLSITPWNFPLAIFTGQLCAALVAGNTVVLKPAEKTSLIAARVVALLYEAGLPPGVAGLVISPGRPAGESLIPDSRVKGVMFTGATDTARWIYRCLLARPDFPLPFVAETGGQNAMIVDSTALPEQVVDDVIRSGFHSAGQRCSSLRVLYIQRDIAPALLDMLKGAMAELVIGDPADIATDVGPVIDSAALARLDQHINYLDRSGRRLYRCALSQTLAKGHYFAPALYEIPDLAVLPGEVFGPIVHVCQYDIEELDGVIDAVNGTAYGLTLGIHSRVAGRADYIARRARVGNVYINRDMIGAVVGVQPFGGRGLSGTGPKAGGPYYLYPLIEETGKNGRWTLARPDNSRGDDAPHADGVATLGLLEQQCQGWQSMEVAQRLQILLDFLDGPFRTGFDAQSGIEDLTATLREIAPHLEGFTALAGPTGERNVLLLEARGIFLCCLAESPVRGEMLQALLCALLAGNGVLLVPTNPRLQWLVSLLRPLADAGAPLASSTGSSGHSDARSELSALLRQPVLGGVIVDRSAGGALREELRQREGKLLPVITHGVGLSTLYKLIDEKTVTENTTAIGGNAALVSGG